MKLRIGIAGMLMVLGPLLSGCHKALPSDDPQQNVQTEDRRARDCADPQWKTDNLGLWNNLCRTNGH